MFKILGADGREYGPTTIEQIKEWIKQGRVNHETMAQAAGDAGWKPLAQFAEFADLFPAKPPLVAPAPVSATPDSPAALPSADARTRAQQMVAGPAMGLIIMAVLGLALQILGIILNIVGVSFPPRPPDLNPEAMRMFHLLSGVAGLVGGVIGIAVSVFIIYSALKMQKLTSHGLALAGAILAMVPCFSPCCLLGLPIGIWALVVLNKPEVRSQFEH